MDVQRVSALFIACVGFVAAGDVTAQSMNMVPPFSPGTRTLDCDIPPSTKSNKSCKDYSPITIQIIEVKDINKNVSACIAALPYNILRIHTSSAGANQDFVFKYVLDTTDTKYRFRGKGVNFASDVDTDDGGDVDPDSIVTATSSSTETAVTLKNGVSEWGKGSASIAHAPIVIHVDGKRKVRCAGVDPVMINTLD